MKTIAERLLRTNFEMPWRPAFESVAVIGWGAAITMMLMIWVSDSLPAAPMMLMLCVSLCFLVAAFRDSFSLWLFKARLCGQAFSYIAADRVAELMRNAPSMLWLGYGFDWTPRHTQLVTEIRSRNITEFLPPRWLMSALDMHVQDASAVGAPWLHGVDPIEKNVYLPLSALEGNTIIFGTTGSGKTRLFEILIYQAVLRGDVVFVLDPKGDRDLRAVVESACKAAGHPESFLFFHPAFPATSIRIDPLKNWNRVTSIASRIAALMPSEGGGDSFVQFAWRAINLVAQALVYVEDRPTLKKLRMYVEGGAHGLMERVLRTYLTRSVENWEARLAPYLQKARDGKSGIKIAGAGRELLAMCEFYSAEIPPDEREEAVDGLLSMVQHDQAHFGKMIQNILPLLTSLTAGDVGHLLSPDAGDIDDERPIFDSDKMIKGRYATYVGLDSLSDATVASAIGSIVLADLASVAGDIYNYADVTNLPRISVFVDEASEAVNMPLVQMLNKSRGAKFVVTLAAQTYPDFISRMGSKPKADMILGNCNNLIALRTKDADTQKWISDQIGETRIRTRKVSQGSGSESGDFGVELRSNLGYSFGEEKARIIAPEILGMLPNLHYFALVAGGRLVKGRLSKIY